MPVMLVTGIEKQKKEEPIEKADTNNDRLVVKLCGRSVAGERIVKTVVGTEPYFFVAEEEYNQAKLLASTGEHRRVERGDYQAYDGTELVKIVAEFPDDVPDLREQFSDTYESDVVYPRRCSADYNMSGYVKVPKHDVVHVSKIKPLDSEQYNIQPRVSLCDIEVREPDEFDQDFIENAPKEVTAICSYDSYKETYSLFCLDPELKVNPAEIRDCIESNWQDYDELERIENADIQFKRYSREGNLLQAWVNYCEQRRFDLMTGWNFVDFDTKYLLNRVHQKEDVWIHDISDAGYVGNPNWNPDESIDGLPTIDMMNGICEKITFGQWGSKSLDYVSNEKLDVGKMEGSDVSYDRDRTKFMAYNITDVMLTVELERVYDFVSFWMMLSDICAIPPYLVGSEMTEVEGYLFERRDEDEILPDRDEDKELNTISGGLVLPPFDGLEKWVGVVDLKSLYPSSIISCNISRETMTTDPDEADVIIPDVPLNYDEVDGEKITDDDINWELGEGSCVGFDMDEQGILPKYISELFQNRAKMKSQRDEHERGSLEYEMYDDFQRAVKVVMNSFFGVMDNKWFRLSQDGLGAAITGVSRYVSLTGARSLSDAGFETVYGDTDSLFIDLKAVDMPGETNAIDDAVPRMLYAARQVNDDLDQVADDIGLPETHPYSDKDLHGTDRHLWYYEAEKIYERYFQPGKKKRYAGKIVWKEHELVDTIGATGLEEGDSDATEVTKTTQTQFLETMLEGGGFDALSDIVRTAATDIEEMNYTVSELAFPGVLNKPPSEYPNGPIRRSVEYSNQHLHADWSEGDNPWYVYVSDTPYGAPNTDVIAVDWSREELPSGFSLDAEAHIDKTIRKPIEPIANTIGYQWHELRTGHEEQSFMGSQSTDADADNEDEIPEPGEIF